MSEVKVHAGSRDEALAEGAAALGLAPHQVGVEILESDEDGVTALVWALDEPAAAPPAESSSELAPGESQAVAARDCLAELLRLIGLEAEVRIAAETDDEVVLNVSGEDLGVIIGSFGQTLNAVQFLVNLMVNRSGRRQRIVVDAGGYRDRRREKLEQIALEHAQRAKNERRGVILEGLRAAERRIIHTVLQNDPDVVTFSEGDEPHRRLVISPRTH
ncbi:MAG: KH domain-containing protein [Fimbriimonadaceae bacterium]|nr:KH domain-containing protein [Fimbriimonadaceae bacterium]